VDSDGVSLVSYLTFTDKDGSMFVNVSLKNIGNSVAINVHPFCKLGAQKFEKDAMLTFENGACDKLGEQTENDPHAGYILFLTNRSPKEKGSPLANKISPKQLLQIHE
jgi:hypothetical protein